MTVDTIVIGGGIAGLQAAIQLARGLHHVLVIDRGDGRSAVARKYRNVLGFPDGVSGAELRASGTEQARRLGVQFLRGEVAELSREGERFLVTVRGRDLAYASRTLVLATGMTDRLPDIPGLAECLGESMFICPDCDGYEAHGRPTVVIGADQPLVHMAGLLTYYTRQLIAVHHGDAPLSPPLADALRERGILFHQSRVRRIEEKEGVMRAVVLADGTRLEVDRGFVAFPGTRVNTDVVKPLGVRLLPNGHVPVDPRTRETSCPNVWAVGDVVAHSQQVTIAMGDGSQAAIWIHKRLVGMTEPAGSGGSFGWTEAEHTVPMT